MKLWLIAVGFANHLHATTLVCTDSTTSVLKQWIVQEYGVVSTGRFSISQTTTTMHAKNEESQNELVEFNRLEASPFPVCTTPLEGTSLSERTTIFDCNLHGYGRTTFSPSGRSCLNSDFSRVRITYDEKTELVSWQLNYVFGSCFEGGKKSHLTGEDKIEATFRKEQCLLKKDSSSRKSEKLNIHLEEVNNENK